MSEEISKQVTITHHLGLHLRAAGALVQVATKFHSTIHLSHNNNNANAKSIMSILSLAASCGSQLTINANGDDAVEAVQAIVDIIHSDFNL